MSIPPSRARNDASPFGERGHDHTSRIEDAWSHSARSGMRALHDEVSQIRRESMHNGRLDLNEARAGVEAINQKLHADGLLPNLHIELDRKGREHLVSNAMPGDEGAQHGRRGHSGRRHAGHGRRGGHGGESPDMADSGNPFGMRADRDNLQGDRSDSSYNPFRRSSNYSGADNGAGLRGNSNEQKIVNFFVDKGLTPAQAAGIAGNIAHESGSRSGQHELGGGPGFGLAQWGGARKAQLRQFAAESGTSTSDMNTQLNFMWKEMNTTERRSLAAITRTTTASQAAVAFERTYERAGVKAHGSRNNHAQRILAQYHNYGGDNSSLA